MNDQECWKKLKTGDIGALSLLYERYAQRLYDYGGKMTPDITLLEDTLHDLFLNLLNSNKKLTTPDSVKAYLVKSFRNQMLKNLQKQKSSAQQLNKFNYVLIVNNDAPENIDKKITSEQLKAFVELLPAKQKEIIYLRFFHELSYEEISDVMQINMNSTYKLLYKALGRLRDFFSDVNCLIIVTYLLLKLILIK